MEWRGREWSPGSDFDGEAGSGVLVVVRQRVEWRGREWSDFGGEQGVESW